MLGVMGVFVGDVIGGKFCWVFESFLLEKRKKSEKERQKKKNKFNMITTLKFCVLKKTFRKKFV